MFDFFYFRFESFTDDVIQQKCSKQRLKFFRHNEQKI